MFQRILVPVDGSRPSVEAVLYSEYFFKAFGSEIVLLHVISPEMIARQEKVGTNPGEMAAEVLDVSERALRRKGIAATSLVLEGPVAGRICATVLSEKCDLVIMGGRSVLDIPDFLVDSVSEKVSHYARSPVIVVRNLLPLKTLLVAYDGSRSSQRALDVAGEIALRARARLRLVEIKNEGLVPPSESPTGAKILEWHLDMAQRGLTVDMDLRLGKPAEKVIRLAQERAIGLVVIGGSGGEAGREGPGSVTDQVLKGCPSAVMVVK
ncbi:MAG: universal stress protein [Euryarchaeota archaeon]|nr:universal stress protein [Euryarchaeota archaeon]